MCSILLRIGVLRGGRPARASAELNELEKAERPQSSPLVRPFISTLTRYFTGFGATGAWTCRARRRQFSA